MEDLTPEDIAHLQWIYSRLLFVHGEDADVDYMIKLEKIIEKLEQA